MRAKNELYLMYSKEMFIVFVDENLRQHTVNCHIKKNSHVEIVWQMMFYSTLWCTEKTKK